MQVNIDTSDIDGFLRKIGALTVQKTIDRAIMKSVITLEREAKVRTPVVTGLLRNSYETEFVPLEGRLRNFREYAPYVEAKRHFMEGAMNATEPKIRGIFEKEIDAMLQDLTS